MPTGFFQPGAVLHEGVPVAEVAARMEVALGQVGGGRPRLEVDERDAAIHRGLLCDLLQRGA